MLQIIIPYYNLTFFRETLESLALQTDQRFTVYIGNDASSENPEDLLKEYNGVLNFVYEKFSNNLGGVTVAKHWDRCLSFVDSKWFMILGDDDQLSEDAVEQFYKIINDEKNQHFKVLRFQREIIDENGNLIKKRTNYPDFESTAQFLYKRSLNEVGSSLGEYIFRTEDYFKYGIRKYPKAFYSDNMMVLEYSKFGELKNIEDAYALIRISPKSLSGDKDNVLFIREAGWQFYAEIINKYSRYFSKKQLSLFLNIIMEGVKTNKSGINKLEFIQMCTRKIGFLWTLRKIITLLKP